MGKTVLVTGASSGFGKAIALKFLAEGWNVVASMRAPDAGSFPIDDRLRLIRLDVTDAQSVAHAIPEALAAFGRIDALVNNAGIGVMSAVEFTPDAVVREVFETNFFGMMAMCRAIIPVMRKQGGGVILNMTSSMAIAPMPFMSIYGSSKWAIEGFSEALAYELDPFHIRVRLLEPGLAPDTSFGRNAQGRMRGLTPPPYMTIAQSYFEAMQENYPGPFTTVEETAQATFDAASDPGRQLRYLIGADTRQLYAERRTSTEAEFLGSIRDMFLDSAGSGEA